MPDKESTILKAIKDQSPTYPSFNNCCCPINGEELMRQHSYNRCFPEDLYLTRPERELKEKRDTIKKDLKPCPVCNGPVELTVQRESAGMDVGYYDWNFKCQKCGMTVCMAADNFYGRTYSTLEEAVAKWNGRSWFKEEKHDENAR